MGHGNTMLLESGITVEKYTQQLAQYCESENLDDVYIFGHSMNGYAGLCYALQNPENINSV